MSATPASESRPEPRARLRLSLSELRFLHDLLDVELDAAAEIGTEGNSAHQLAESLFDRIGHVITGLANKV